MAGKIEYIAPVDFASGKTFGKKNKWTAVKRAVGNKQKGCAYGEGRNLVLHPYSQAELDQHEAMRQAAKDRASINASTAKYAAWAAAFKAAQEAGTTNCVYLQGFITSSLIKGLVNADLTPNFA